MNRGRIPAMKRKNDSRGRQTAARAKMTAVLLAAALALGACSFPGSSSSPESEQELAAQEEVRRSEEQRAEAIELVLSEQESKAAWEAREQAKKEAAEKEAAEREEAARKAEAAAKKAEEEKASAQKADTASSAGASVTEQEDPEAAAKKKKEQEENREITVSDAALDRIVRSELGISSGKIRVKDTHKFVSLTITPASAAGVKDYSGLAAFPISGSWT